MAEPTVMSLLNQTVSVTPSNYPENLVAQAVHVTTLLYHFRSKTLFLVMRPNPSPLSLVLFPCPPIGG